MEPITMTAITTLLAYWGERTFDEAFNATVGKFTEDSIDWLKSIFFKDDKPNEITERFEEKQDSSARQNAVKAAIEAELEENPDAEKYLTDLVKAIETKAGGGTAISNSKNVNTGSINAGGNITFGDNNQLVK